MKTYERRIKKYDDEVAKVKAILKSLGVKHRISWTKKRMWYVGMFKHETIYVYSRWFKELVDTPSGYQHYTTRRCTVQEFLSTVFHEVGHALQFRANQYQTYLLGFKPNDGFKKFKRWSLEALQAEKGADSIGKKLMKVYFPDIPFKGGYEGRMGRRMIVYMVESIRETYFPTRKSLTPIIKRIKLS